MIQSFFRFIDSIMPELIKIYHAIADGAELSEEEQKQIMLNIIRKAKDKQAKDEIEG